MQEMLMEKLHRYMVNNNPDRVIRLRHDKAVGTYLEEEVEAADLPVHDLLSIGTPAYFIEAWCIDERTNELCM